MPKKLLLPLTLAVISALAAGCATQKNSYGRTNNYGMGLVSTEKGAFAYTPVTSIDANTNEYFGNAGVTSGKQTKVLWGLFSTNDY
jgi:hypothetical protein